MLPNENTRKTLQEVAGYLFVKGLKMEKIFFLFGTGANGKSVFFEVKTYWYDSERLVSSLTSEGFVERYRTCLESEEYDILMARTIG